MRERVAAVGLALASVVAALAILACSWWSYHAAIAPLKRERDVHERALRDVPALQAALAQLGRVRAAGNYFYPERQASDAAARMRADLEAVVATGGATVLRDDVELAASGDGPTELHGEIAFLADARALSRILYRLRQARPLLIVTRLSVRTGAERARVEIAAKAFVSSP